MSNQFFEIKWRKAIKLFQETYELELEPLKEQLAKVKPKNDQDWYKHYSLLYINYLQIFKEIEVCCEFSNNPQKKEILKDMLNNVLKRTLLVKRDLIRFYTFHPTINSDFIEMEKILEENQKIPENLEITIPQYFITEQDPIRKQQIDSLFSSNKDFNKFTESHPLYSRKTPQIMTINQAIQNIINFERGRQTISSGLQHKERLLSLLKKHEQDQNTKSDQKDDAQKAKNNIVIIQKYIRSFFERKNYFYERKNEHYFLKTEHDDGRLNAQNEIINKIKINRRQQLKEVDKQIEQSYFSIKQNLLENEGVYIREMMLNERRKFIVQRFEESNGKSLPSKIQEFYQQNENKENELKDKKNQKAPPKGKGKPTEEDQFLKERIHLGPENSVEITNMRNLIDQYNREWGDQINMSDNYINRDIIIQKIFPEIKQEIQQHVDKIIQIELENLHFKLKITKKKEPKPPKKINVKPPKIPGENLVKDKNPQEIGKELLQFHILRKELPKNLSDFLTTDNLIREEQIQQGSGIGGMIDPSLAQLKRCIVENIGIPLGCGFNPEQRNRTFLFYGYEGTGKSLMIKIMAHQTNSILLDISPYNLVNIFNDKVSIQKIMYKVFYIAKQYQPAIIMFDEVEHFFGKKNLKKLKHFAGKCSKFKKELNNQINKHLTPEDRVIVIGMTKNPQYVNLVEAKKFFYKKFYFPFPDYASRRQIFQHIINQRIKEYVKSRSTNQTHKTVNIHENFPYQMLAYQTEGFSIGAIQRVIQQILTSQRLERLELMPLKIDEFVEYLADQEYCSGEQYQIFREFGWAVNGFKELAEKKEQVEKENAKNQKKRKQII